MKTTMAAILAVATMAVLSGCGDPGADEPRPACDQACMVGRLWDTYAEAAASAQAAHAAYTRDFTSAWDAAGATCTGDCSDRTAMAASDPIVVADLADLNAKTANADAAYEAYSQAAVNAGIQPDPPIDI